MNKIMSMCGLESRPRWIDIADHYMCSSCGETTYEKHPPTVCPNCKQYMCSSRGETTYKKHPPTVRTNCKQEVNNP